MSKQYFAWLLLSASVISEVVGTLALKYSDGFTRLVPTLATLACYGCAIWLMSVSVKYLEVGLTYAVWAGAGTALITLMGILVFNESASLLRLCGIAFIIVGVITLNLSNH
jgi:small multidrug resistance pump